MLQVWFWDDKLNAGVHCLPKCRLVYFVNTWLLWACSSKDRTRNLCMHAFDFALLWCIYCSLLGKLPGLPHCNSNLNVVMDGRMYNQIICSHGALHDYHKTIVSNLFWGRRVVKPLKIKKSFLSQKNNRIIHNTFFPRGFESLWVIFIYFMFKNLLQLHTIWGEAIFVEVNLEYVCN